MHVRPVPLISGSAARRRRYSDYARFRSVSGKKFAHTTQNAPAFNDSTRVSVTPVSVRPKKSISFTGSPETARLIGVAAAAVGGCDSPSVPATPSQTKGARAPRDLLSIGAVERDGDGQVVALQLFGRDVTDAELPPANGTFFFMVRIINPVLGSWGTNSEGAERFPCGT